MEKILQAFSDIADVLPRLDRLKTAFPDDTNFDQVVGLIYSDIIEFHRRAYKFFRRKAWHLWFAFDWGLFERRFKTILQNLASHCDLLDKEAAATHFIEMKQLRERRQSEVDTYEQHRHTQMIQDVRNWLSAVEDQQENRLDGLSDRRQLETCDWILQDSQMQPWIDDDSGDAILWMTGIPGAGKSYLCSLLVENLRSQQRFSTLYYFCDHQSPGENACAMILRTLAVQLLQQNTDVASLVHQAYLMKASNRSVPTMKKLLAHVLPTSKVARIVIDGIDELDDATQQETLRSLVEIQKNAGQFCKLLFSSREEPKIKKSLTAKKHLKLGEKTLGGISLYIKESIKEIQIRFPGIDPNLINRAEHRLHSKAKGMFLWVRLVTKMLVDQISEWEFEHAIDELPDGLEEAYGIIKSRIHALCPVQLRQRAFSILYWVCVARRPVSLHEIVDGIALCPGQKTLSKRTRCSNPSRDVIEFCAPLLEVQKNGVVGLVHFSAKEYFVHEKSGHFVDLAEAHLKIAFSCVINLTSCLDLVRTNKDGLSGEDIESRVVQGYYGLQSYGQDFWAEHALEYLRRLDSQDSVSRELMSALQNFSQVWKHHTDTKTLLPIVLTSAETSSGLSTLYKFPPLHDFVSGWLHFQSEFQKMMPNLNDLGAQTKWRLETDGTVLSLIDSRLCIITERLLSMQSSQLPSHIDKDDFKDFKSRFKFLCRFHGCHCQFDSVKDRDCHEESHVLSFPCPQCDFSGRGFRSRKDLEKHTQKYHMSPDDFEIPENLHTMGGSIEEGSSVASRALDVSSGRSGRWTERGRKAIQQGFHDVLNRFESEIAAAKSNVSELGSKDINSLEETGPSLSQYTDEAATMMTLESIRHNVQDQKYESLADFKNDLSVLSRGPTAASVLGGDQRIESICDNELKKAMSAFSVFANFDDTNSMGVTSTAMSMNSTEQIRGSAKDFNGNTDMDGSKSIPFGVRVPHWSVPEMKQFPELLQRHGRNFASIADHLKTKTPEEVNQHFDLLSKGDAEFLSMADLADAKLQREASRTGTDVDCGDAELEIPRDDFADGISYDFLQSNQVSYTGPGFPPFGTSQSPLPPRQSSKSQAESHAEAEKDAGGPTRKKRRPPLRVPCPHCSINENGLRDEYALKKHIDRYHAATRKVWICEDISIDKRFLTRCKSCSANKRYTSKAKASNHLRKAHFVTETSGETLQRWMRETKEPNPKLQTPSADAAPMIRPTKKRATTRGTIFSVPPIKHHIDGARTLPSTILQVGSRTPSKSLSSPRPTSSLDDNVDEDEDTDASEVSVSSPEADSHMDDVLFEDISFDNFIPGNASQQRLLDNQTRAHWTNRALIKPDQVPRLPNLDSLQKTKCLDQVEALYSKLDNALGYSSQYKEALEDLTSLSRWLMRNLRDWRRHSTLAPDIPFSI